VQHRGRGLLATTALTKPEGEEQKTEIQAALL